MRTKHVQKIMICKNHNKKLPNDDPLKRKPSIELAKLKYNWEPKVDLDDGLDLTINFFKKTSL